MANLVSIAVSALWVLGLAVILATVGYSDWLARERGIRLRQALTRRECVIAVSLGMALVALGLAGGAQGTVRLLWLILMLGCGAQAWRAWRAGGAT